MHESIICELGLVPHPDGGYYREVYRSPETIAGPSLPSRFGAARSFATHIYFLLPAGNFSALHRIKSDELWHHYAGAPLTVHTIDPQGRYEPVTIGRLPYHPFAAVTAGTWFGAEVAETDGYSLVGCTVAPGFDFADFELARRAELLKKFPHSSELIARLTRS